MVEKIRRSFNLSISWSITGKGRDPVPGARRKLIAAILTLLAATATALAIYLRATAGPHIYGPHWQPPEPTTIEHQTRLL